MVKHFCALLIVLAFAVPAFAQKDYPMAELGFGYGNVGFGSLGGLTSTGRHSAFATHQTYNLNSVVGIENYLGYYWMGSTATYGKAELFTDVFGGKFSYRAPHVTLYGVAGIGGGFLRFPQSGVGTNNSMATRVGGGLDIPINDSFSWKVDVSRMGFHFGTWNYGTNVSTGIVLNITR